ncbi:MAG: thiamine phosphate synthase [Veillonellaceae bacterium]|nr:thiamine phosphate synthase [Veillonellaceae bacterium]
MSIRDKLDISAYLVVGPENTNGRPVKEIVEAALSAGFTCFQMRSKTASAREMISLCGDAAEVIAEAGKSDDVALLVDDRLDVVLAAREGGIKVDGIHVGQSDIPVDVCRKYLGEDSIVGLSARTDELFDYVEHADTAPIDYFGAGPLHETATKPDCGRDRNGNIITRSLDDVRKLSHISPVPVVVGGGVKAKDIPGLAKTGTAGFFVVSAVAGADDPYAAAAEFVDLWNKSK